MSYYVRDNLANIVESVTPADIPAAVDATEDLGGYFRRWRGGALQRWTKWASGTPAEEGKDRLTLDERLTLAFLKVSPWRGGLKCSLWVDGGHVQRSLRTWRPLGSGCEGSTPAVTMGRRGARLSTMEHPLQLRWNDSS